LKLTGLKAFVVANALNDIGEPRTQDMARVTLDTTVHPKNVTFPTDAKLTHSAIKGLSRLAKKHGVKLASPICASPGAPPYGRALCPCQTVPAPSP
jgi:hypothetical protein